MTHDTTHTRDDAPRARRRIPPLAWIVVALVAVWLVAYGVQRLFGPGVDDPTPATDNIGHREASASSASAP